MAPDVIMIDSGDGGAGAAAMPLMGHVGLTVRERLFLVCDILVRHGVKDRNHKKSLQRAPAPRRKAKKASASASALFDEVETIARSAGAPEPRALNRTHVRRVQDDDASVSLEDFAPYPKAEAMR